jgi:hypothetical protein
MVGNDGGGIHLATCVLMSPDACQKACFSRLRFHTALSLRKHCHCPLHPISHGIPQALALGPSFQSSASPRAHHRLCSPADVPREGFRVTPTDVLENYYVRRRARLGAFFLRGTCPMLCCSSAHINWLLVVLIALLQVFTRERSLGKHPFELVRRANSRDVSSPVLTSSMNEAISMTNSPSGVVCKPRSFVRTALRR